MDKHDIKTFIYSKETNQKYLKKVLFTIAFTWTLIIAISLTLNILAHFILWIIILFGILYFIIKESINIRQKDEIYNELKNNQKYLTILFDATPTIMITTNGKEIDKANHAMLKFFDYHSVEKFKEEHSCICDFFIAADGLLSSKMDNLTWLEYLLSQQDKYHKAKMLKDDKVHTFVVLARPIHIDKDIKSVVIFTDITEAEDAYTTLKEQENIMMAQSRHAAMGEMISMIAHQWRQPISVIAMGANNILADIELEMVDETTLKSGAEDIVKQTQELSKTINDFKNFFKPKTDVEEVFLEDIFNDVFTVIGKSLENNNIKVIKELPTDLKIKTYARELMQVFINIIKNSKEAIVDNNNEGKISILVKEDKGEIIIKICDSGGGIKKEIIGKIFNPYFSTKSKNTGTGIGLYMSKTIVERHLNGILIAYNTDTGACFEMKLPMNNAQSKIYEV
ncbi:MAG: HAMP domain-containing sensor histidine kinase [Campylobacterota bacterium]|nr:HAMP domain-containing sensor histidine kinase [Campylobacterota bacterium]